MSGVSSLQKRADPSEPSERRAAEWLRIEGELDGRGWSVIPRLLTAEVCASLRALYPESENFRNRIEMQRHGYGRGEYQYFRYPLPVTVQTLRAQLYPHLVPIANRWSEAMRREARFPEQHNDFLQSCHRAGQVRPTPLLLKYAQGDYNCLHQDLYGEHVFPLQVAVLLSQPMRDFEGGDFVLTEQRPRMQSRAHVVPLEQGDGVVFAVEKRPARRSAPSGARAKMGTRGSFQVNMRHGVSELRKGERFTLGIIFHDAT
jgi:hypothetical protein